MSQMIKCDSCEKMMYSDSRSEKGDYHEIWVDRSSSYHLCRYCFTKFMEDVLNAEWDHQNNCWKWEV